MLIGIFTLLIVCCCVCIHIVISSRVSPPFCPVLPGINRRPPETLTRISGWMMDVFPILASLAVACSSFTVFFQSVTVILNRQLSRKEAN